MISSLYQWAFYGKNYRVIVAAVILFISRFALQAIWVQEYPPGYNWAYPGLYSIFVPYGETADFFFSGHVGICSLVYFEHLREGNHKMKKFALFTMLAQVFLMVVLRSHFTVDMVSAFIFAHYAFLMSESYLS